MSVPGNRTMNPALDGGGWSPERELMEAAPRRYAPSSWPDYNQPNAMVLLGLGGLLLVFGLILFFVAFVVLSNKKDALYIIGGAIMAVGGAVLIAWYPAQRKAHLDRAANLVENGAPVMARIVNVQNMTGDSEYGRLVTYMVTLPGASEETRREVKADDRALPKRIPGPATALLDFKNNDIELYCVLPFVAVSKFATAPVQNDLSQTGIPTQVPQTPTMAASNLTAPAMRQSQSQSQVPPPVVPPVQTPTPAGGMSTLGEMGTQPTPPEKEDTPKEPKKPKKPAGAAKLPWEQ